jgi:multicomponent Na+:H+ antiporter subunit F
MIFVSKLVILILSVTIFFCLYRAVLGPEVPDKIIAINVIGTKAVVMFVLVGVVFDEGFFFDVAMVYVVLLYISTLALMKYLEFGRLD